MVSYDLFTTEIKKETKIMTETKWLEIKFKEDIQENFSVKNTLTSIQPMPTDLKNSHGDSIAWGASRRPSLA